MHHVAIMKKSWGLTDKILTGQKTVESRWYKSKRAPWDKIVSGDTVYFKNAGEPVGLKATVARVLAFADLTPLRVNSILSEYGSKDGIEEDKIGYFYERFKDKKYCLLIFLKDVEKVEPFFINKTGYGARAAWLTLNTIDDVRVATRESVKTY